MVDGFCDVNVDGVQGFSYGGAGGRSAASNGSRRRCAVVGDLGFVTNSTGSPSRPLAVGRASRSCRLTTRLTPSGVVPAIRCRVCPGGSTASHSDT